MERVGVIATCVKDADRRLQQFCWDNKIEIKPQFGLGSGGNGIHLFSQMWSSTAGAFNGIGGQAFTSYWTCVIVSREQNIAFVYHNNGRFAYSCKWDDNAKNCLANESFPGHSDIGRKSFKLEVIDKYENQRNY
jgi:hypothetical protein